ncbi:hypothetical protein [Cupriavidus consociatus]|uniref:hypothetical protein n=1 Tax=Cupriavidus consociatus TaxID=2821357 RepID=UPI001AEB1629|nr:MULTISPECIES: hypothetical protein [unclassified Cupriavidus]MBP0622876.1 hypothetical protein [Cupriavidus sp. LEh25]MDK2659563.1 hypothetical protein [Cupriavidus sp. LEh21]
MVIAMMTAEIILDGRETSEADEIVFEAAELLRDRDFGALCAWLERGRFNSPANKAGPASERLMPNKFQIKSNPSRL